ncbi:vimentin isoform X1 [Hydra vulgaris]|uniref:vimentin isoform X1 n=1 Tax=Hydra vulgaris TaxID=6087 RepID=UPI0032E9D11A
MSDNNRSETTDLLTQRRLSKIQALSLSDRFKNYIEKVNSMRDQCKKIENNVFLTQVSSLQNEIHELKLIYERELENQRDQLDSVTSERNTFHLEAMKSGSQLAEMNDKYNYELSNRKKVENALADSQRLLTEKDMLIQELRIAIGQHQNCSIDLRKELEDCRNQLNTFQTKYEIEANLSSELEADVQKLSSQLFFEREIQKTEVIDLKNKVVSAQRALEIAEQKLSDHDLYDEKLHFKVEAIRRKTQQEMLSMQEQLENNYQTQLQEYKNLLEQEKKNLIREKEDNINLKKIIEEMNLKIIKLDRKCSSSQYQNRGLCHVLEIERQTAVNKISHLEEKLSKMKENLDMSMRELNLAKNSNIPINLEIAALSNLLEAEESRLKLALLNPPGELALSARGELMPTKIQRRSLPGSPRTGISLNTTRHRTKSTSAMFDMLNQSESAAANPEPVNHSQRKSPPQQKYNFLPPLTLISPLPTTSREIINGGISHPPKTFGNTALPLIYKPKN